jgi:hypothetical protein
MLAAFNGLAGLYSTIDNSEHSFVDISSSLNNGGLMITDQ